MIDEIGYLSYDARAADLLFQVVSRRYERRSLVLTTNLPFSEWPNIFPNAATATAPDRPRRPSRRDHYHRRGELPPARGRDEAEVGPRARRPLTRRLSVQIPAVSRVRQQHPAQTLVSPTQNRRSAVRSLGGRLSLVHGDLVTQGEVIEGEVAVAAAEEGEETKQVEQQGDH